MSRVTYTVKPGDTLAGIAQWFFGDWREWPQLQQYNKLENPNLIEPGQVLEIPPWMPRRFQFPLTETETDYYKFGDRYASGPWQGKPHPGVDFHQAEGVPVYAVGDGIVRRHSYDPKGYGCYLVIEHRLSSGVPVWSLYAHTVPLLGDDLRGEWVTGGQAIAEEGATGAANGWPHVHTEIKRTPDLDLYPRLTVDNLTDFYHDPQVFLSTETFLPVSCWGCLHRGETCS